LHRAALEGLSIFAGNWRPAGVEIEKSKHTPPGAHLVPELIEAMCDYVNDNWEKSSPVHLAAYVLWRLNWIHPFADGNGRTARALSFVVICVKSEQILPGQPTYPEMIVQHRKGYFEALDAADAACKQSQRIDVSKMEQLLESLVAKQLAAIYEKVMGKSASQQ
jgi:Fic family protein